MDRPPDSRYERYGKRILDLSLALPTAILTIPLQVIVAALIRWKLGSPVLFRQTRTGKHGRPFELIKFRTMTDATHPSGSLLTDAQRLGPFGRWLRSTSLDELPQLWQVVAGTMSMVGPRPLLPEYLPYYSERQQKRHTVKPGITGWAQIHGRNATTWDERLAHDVWYVEHQGFLLDLRILALTLHKVFLREGAAAADGSGMPNFADQQQARDGTD